MKIKAVKSRCRSWLKRMVLGGLAIIGLVMVFHRPIFFEVTRYFVLRAAKQQNLDVDYEMRGSIFSTLSVIGLRATPVEPGPIKLLEVGEINLRYSIRDLIRNGLPSFLKILEVRDVVIELEPDDPLPREKEVEAQEFKFPALIPELLNLENINLLISSPSGNTVLKGFHFSLLPDKAGILKIEMLDIPGVHRWSSIDAQTSYQNRNLILSQFIIGEEIALRELQLNMSEIDAGKIQVAMDGRVFDGSISLVARVEDLNASNQLDLKLRLSDLALERVSEYLNLGLPLTATIRRLDMNFSGTPDAPSTWTNDVQLRVEDVVAEPWRVAVTDMVMNSLRGQAEVQVHGKIDPENTFSLTATAVLPESFDKISNMAASGQLQATIIDAAALPLPDPIIGGLALTANFRIKDGISTADAIVVSDSIVGMGAEVLATEMRLNLQKNLTLSEDAPWFQTLEAALEVRMGAAAFQGYQAESVFLSVGMHETAVTLREFALASGKNSVHASGTYFLPSGNELWDKQPMTAEFTVEAPALADFVAPDGEMDLQGVFRASGKVASKDGVIAGDAKISGQEIEVNGLPVQSLEADVRVAESSLTVSRLAVVMNDKNHIHGSGDIELDESFTYRGMLDVALVDLSMFQFLLGDANEVAGSLRLTWTGSGEVFGGGHSGDAYLSLSEGRYGDFKDLAASFHASYKPDFIHLPDFYASAGVLGDLMFSLFWQDNRLQISHLTVRQNQSILLDGEMEVPLHLMASGDFSAMLPSSEPVMLNLKSTDVRVDRVMQQFGISDPPLQATLNLHVSAAGSLDALQANVNFHASEVIAAALEALAPAELQFLLRVKDNRVTLDGTVQQALIEPLKISAHVPFDAAEVIKNGELDLQTPLDVRVQLPESSLEAVPTIVPFVRQSRGTAAMDVRMAGTLEEPVLTGRMQADIRALRFTDPSLPSINDFEIRINLAENRVVVDRCAGGFAGGTFSLSGNVDLTTMENPVFDLQMSSTNALVLQNDDMTVRISSALRVRGPLAGASVDGDIWVVRSRFFKNIEILPIGLPGRPAPQPPAEPAGVSFPEPPLRDWKIDIRIRTQDQDPFLVHGNLARGRIAMDLRLGGTGLRPWMDGTVNIDQLTASLPFSRLEIDSGQIFFNQQEPFIPQLNIQGTSTIRDYDVTVFITGPATAPEAVFTSNPPLPQSEVVALIATGMTTDELTQDPNALAGRAAILVFQRIYNSVFRRNRTEPPDDSFLSRIQFDIGVADPSTGRQSTAVRVPLSEQIMLMGGMDVGGNFRGQVKYLIRFR